MTRRSLLVFTVVMVSLLTGCAGYAPHEQIIGQDLTALIAQMGPPERETLSDGHRKLHFVRGPGGWDTYFVYLDANNRVVRWEQVLTEERFDTIRSGMTREQVIDTIGTSTITHGLARDRGYVWHYRYKTTQCRSFAVEFTPEHVVRSAGYLFRARQCRYVGR